MLPAGPTTKAGVGLLGDWYATLLFWKPQVALFLNESTRWGSETHPVR